MAKKQFERGCCLSGCLAYLGCASLLLILASGFLCLAIGKSFLAHHMPHSLKGWTPSILSLVVGSLPVAGLVLGIVEFLQIRAIWQGYRWGAYGLFLLILSQIVVSLWGMRAQQDLWDVLRGIAYFNIPLITLFILLLPKWRAMR